MKNCLLVFVLLSSAVPLQAQQWIEPDQWSLRWLGNVCSSFEVEDKLICGSYLQGVFAGQQAEVQARDKSQTPIPEAFCRPADMTIEQMAKIVSKFALEQADASTQNAHIALARHFSQIWPCDS